MNRPTLPTTREYRASNDKPTAQVWLIRACREQKAFVAKALEVIERLDAWREHCVEPEALADLEERAQRLGLFEVCAAMRSVGQVLLARDASSIQHFGANNNLPPVPPSAARHLSALLLRVYLTGTDAGGNAEREQVQEVIAAHMQAVLPSAGYSKNVHN